MRTHRWLIPALSVTLMTSYGSLYYAMAVLARPIQAELGWSGDITLGAYSLALLIAGLCAYSIGKIIDQNGGRLLMTSGSAIAGVFLLALSQVHSVYAFYALWAGLGVAMAMTQYEAAFSVVVATYPHAYRNRISLLTLAGGLSSTTFWPITYALVEGIGWRGTTAALGAFTLAVCAPLHWYAVPKVVHADVRATGVTPELPTQLTSSLRKTLSMPTFWLVAFAFAAFGFVNNATAMHSIPLLESRGISAVTAVSIAASIGPMQVASRFADLLFNGRLPALTLGAITVVLIPLGLAMLLPSAGTMLLPYMFVIIYGAGLGLITIARATSPPEFFGVQRYGAINGLLSAPATIARALGPVVSAAVLTASHNYTLVLVVLIAVGAAGAACYWSAALLQRQRVKVGALHAASNR
ncbi:MAG: MFS transporter [Sulfurifustaceae bacterium]